MIKSSREVRDFNETVDILRRCDSVRIGLNDTPYPYVVPMSFGYDADETERSVTIYFHGARNGKKHALIARDPHVCVEADLMRGYPVTENRENCSVTTDYESFIGYGIIEEISGEDAERAVEKIFEHCGRPGFVYDKRLHAVMRIYRVKTTDFTGKRRFNK